MSRLGAFLSFIYQRFRKTEKQLRQVKKKKVPPKLDCNNRVLRVAVDMYVLDAAIHLQVEDVTCASAKAWALAPQLVGFNHVSAGDSGCHAK